MCVLAYGSVTKTGKDKGALAGYVLSGRKKKNEVMGQPPQFELAEPIYLDISRINEKELMDLMERSRQVYPNSVFDFVWNGGERDTLVIFPNFTWL